jgi:hypothetical protein
MQNAIRVVGASLLCPLALALLMSLPALGSMAAIQWFLFSAAICVPLFLLCAAVSHFVLRRKSWSRLGQYVRVMFWVSTVVLFTLRIAVTYWIFGNGGSEFHLGTQVIENGQFTIGGIALLAAESMFGALWLAAAFALFWVLTVRARATA